MQSNGIAAFAAMLDAGMTLVLATYLPILVAALAILVLEADLLALLGRFDRGGPAGLVVPGSYVEVVITRR